MFWTAYALVSFLVILHAIGSLWGGILFWRYVRRRLAMPPPAFTPRTLVLLPCKGLDEKLARTIRALDDQDYPQYRVICAVESADDPARALAERIIAELGTKRIETVVSRRATARSQKIENLVAGIQQAGDWPEAYAFIDSDAVPHRQWLRHLVAALAEDGVGAATGYRWYVAGGSLAGLVRCLWNAVALTFLGDHDRNFCWGGSMAIRRELFERLGMLGRWERALSEDYQVARATYDAKMKVRFVPQCVIPCYGEPTWREFWTFARRQLIITRVCEPRIWKAAAAVTANFVVGFWGPLLVLAWGLITGRPEAVWAGGAVLAVVYASAVAKAGLRQSALLRILPGGEPAGLAAHWDVFGSPLVATLNAALMVASGVSRRFEWRGTRYEMRSPLETVVLSKDAG